MSDQLPNIFLDKLVHPRIHLFHRSWSAFHFCGITGFLLALVLAFILITHLGLSYWVIATLMVTAAITFFTLAMLTKIITGDESVIYYHHEIAVLAVSTLALWLMDQPVLAYLDVTILGIGTFLIFGRCGCLMVGCCHGVPHRWGVCYREEHAEEGFTPYYVDIRLFPIQAVESFYVLCVVVVGTVLAWNGTPGEALAWYIIAYDIGRFSFEFVRGDPSRPYYFGFSEGQWISVGLMLVIVWSEQAGLLNFHLWHVVATGSIVLLMGLVALIRRYRPNPTHRLLNPSHVKEVAEAMDHIAGLSVEKPNAHRPSAIHIGCTSLGIQVSTGKTKQGVGELLHYALSNEKGGMTESDARVIADLICRLKHPSIPNRLLRGGSGVFHLLVSASDENTAVSTN